MPPPTSPNSKDEGPLCNFTQGSSCRFLLVHAAVLECISSSSTLSSNRISRRCWAHKTSQTPVHSNWEGDSDWDPNSLMLTRPLSPDGDCVSISSGFPAELDKPYTRGNGKDRVQNPSSTAVVITLFPALGHKSIQQGVLMFSEPE